MNRVNLALLGIVLAVFNSCGSDEDPGIQETDTKLYVANSQENTISVVDLDNFSVSETIPLSSAPYTVRLHPLRSSLYITQPARAGVTKLLQRDATVLANISTPGAMPYEMLFSLDSSFAYVSLPQKNTVGILRLAEDRLLQEIAVGQGPRALSIDSFGGRNRLFVVNGTSKSISVIELFNNQVSKTISVGANPRSVTFRDTLVGYVADAASGKALGLKLDKLEADATLDITLGVNPAQLAMKTGTNLLLALNEGDNSLHIIDPAKPEDRTILATGAGPTQMLINSLATRLYVANTAGNSVTIIDLQENKVLATVPVGNAPTSMTLF